MGGGGPHEVRVLFGGCPHERVGVDGEVGEDPGGEVAAAGDLDAGLPLFSGCELCDSFRWGGGEAGLGDPC